MNVNLTEADIKAIGEAAFALECVAHLQGKERLLLPHADYLRALEQRAKEAQPKPLPELKPELKNPWPVGGTILSSTRYGTPCEARLIAGLFIYSGFGMGNYYSASGEKVWCNHSQARDHAKAEGVELLYWDSFDFPPESIRITAPRIKLKG